MTIPLTGRPCHHAKITREDDHDGPDEATCDCGAIWSSLGPAVSEWYWAHVAPPAAVA